MLPLLLYQIRLFIYGTNVLIDMILLKKAYQLGKPYQLGKMSIRGVSIRGVSIRGVSIRAYQLGVYQLGA